MSDITTAENHGSDLSWEIDVPLISNRVMVGGLARVFAITGVVMVVLMAVLMGAQGEWEAIVPLSLGLLGGCLGLFLLSLLIMLVVFRNKMRFRFTVSDEGVRMETIDKTVKSVNRAAMVGGVLGSSATTTGAGLLSASRETEEALWSGAFVAHVNERAHLIVLRNAWRGLLYVYCTPEIFPRVVARARAEMTAHGTAERVAKRSPLGRNIALTVAVVVACLPAFAMVEALDVPLWLPLILMCFAVAMVWFVGVFGWVVLAMIAAQIGYVALGAFVTSDSLVFPGEHYVGWQLFSGDDWALIVVTLIAFAFLAWLSVRAIRGRFRSVLESDYADMGE